VVSRTIITKAIFFLQMFARAPRGPLGSRHIEHIKSAVYYISKDCRSVQSSRSWTGSIPSSVKRGLDWTMTGRPVRAVARPGL
jgi:hypothetical protein